MLALPKKKHKSNHLDVLYFQFLNRSLMFLKISQIKESKSYEQDFFKREQKFSKREESQKLESGRLKRPCSPKWRRSPWP